MSHLYPILKPSATLLIFVALVGCTNRRPQTNISTPDSPPSETTEVAEKNTDSDKAQPNPSALTESSSEQSSSSNASSLQPRRYCYEVDTDTLSATTRLSIDSDQTVTGDSRATIHNEEASYFTSYAQRFSGELLGSQLELDITTWIEYDVQDRQETLTVTSETLDTGDEVLNAIGCEAARDRFVDLNGLESADLLDSAVTHTQRVQFEPGTNFAVLENSVIRGERDVYFLRAEGGQTMTLDISSLGNNAVFDVVSPSGFILTREARNEEILLPETGDYQIIVGGTRGNATYTLRVEIN